MRKGFLGGVVFGAVMGATISIIAEENFKMDRSVKAMKRAGKNIGRCAGRAYSTMRHMIF
ncbi:MAG: hypothetical protein ACOYEI_05830 [Acetivibrionales bacterium]|jgi:gas vesicle protein|nr:hypothetical protein [Clostridiaceae bacterium]